MMESRVMTDFSAVVERSGEAGKQAMYRRQRDRDGRGQRVPDGITCLLFVLFVSMRANSLVYAEIHQTPVVMSCFALLFLA